MPVGELQGLYQDMVLTNVAGKRKKTGLVMPRIMPSLNVNKPTGLIYMRDPNNIALKVQDTVRAIGGESKALYGSAPSTIEFKIHDHSLTDILPDELRLADSVLQDDINKVEGLQDALDLEREVKGPALIKSTLVTAGQTDSPTDKFDDTSAGDPIAYLLKQIAEITPVIGIRPNLVAMDYAVADAIMTHPKTVERVKYTLPVTEVNAGIGSMERMLAVMLAIPEVIISEGHVQNVAPKGGTQSLTSIWSDEVLIGFKETPNTNYAGLGLHLIFNGAMQTGSAGVLQVVNGYAIERARNARRFSDEFFIHGWYTDKIINPNAGIWITDTLT